MTIEYHIKRLIRHAQIVIGHHFKGNVGSPFCGSIFTRDINHPGVEIRTKTRSKTVGK